MTALVQATGLYKFHTAGAREIPVLRDVTVSVEPGEFVCVMGPSGSGKTTLLHALSGLERPNSGRVLLGGQDLYALTERRRTLARRSGVGYVFQFFNLLPNLTVAENVGLPIAIAGARLERRRSDIQTLLDRLGLADKLDAFPHQLSGGELQRTGIARALIGDQPLLLCDEPTGNLAQQAGKAVMELLRGAVNDEGRGALLVTHNPRDAAFCDRVHFLVDGELVPEVELHGPDIAVRSIHEALAKLAI